MKKIFSSKKRVAAIGVITAATMVGGGMAVAYWTSSGSGTGDATTASSDAVVTITGDAVSDMYPGDAEQDLIVTASNVGTNNAYVAGVTAYVTTDAVPPAACDGSNYLINGDPAGTPVDLNWEPVDLAGGDSASTGALGYENTIQFNNKDEEQDDCQGVTVRINYASS